MQVKINSLRGDIVPRTLLSLPRRVLADAIVYDAWFDELKARTAQ